MTFLKRKLIDNIYYLKIKGRPCDIEAIAKEVEPMLESKDNLKRDFDSLYIFSISNMFVNDLKDDLFTRYKYISMSVLRV